MRAGPCSAIRRAPPRVRGYRLSFSKTPKMTGNSADAAIQDIQVARDHVKQGGTMRYDLSEAARTAQERSGRRTGRLQATVAC